RGLRLLIRRGPALAALRALAAELGADAVCWSRRVEPALSARDARVAKALREDGLEVRTFESCLLFSPDEVRTGAGEPFRVFTPFWRACLARPEPEPPRPVPPNLSGPASWPRSEALDSLGLLPSSDWAAGLRLAWRPGEKGARERLDAFVSAGAGGYAAARDRPAVDGVSRLSPHLHFGEVSAREVWAAVSRRAAHETGRGPEAYLRQLGWREFAHHLLAHFPRTVSEPLRPEFAGLERLRDARSFAAWSRGRTGFPLVDAGMRELWRTGWMHNRARMICASFLVKDLLADWRDGAAWFWDTLVDADQANNTLGWQWTAGCGADAAPYFRVFNPTLQARRFDPDGAYVRRWVPELRRTPPEWIFEPLRAPRAVLAEAGAYPLPLVDHAKARARALAAYGRLG
ncbi:MAG: deoxyribodipyrimidine photo-lyase, partial [Elusimicrobia bacterium]|nr:deoxyribodipyrimidine photo-lyase [Elusimicrobiota bacterium]